MILRTREWLKNNEIFFKTIFLLALTITGLYISYVTYQNSVYQTKISETQIMPIFRFNQILQNDGAGLNFTGDIVEIFNDGYTIRNFEFESVNFIEFQYTNPAGERYQTDTGPLDGYFSVMERSSNYTGKIVTLTNSEFLRRHNDFYSLSDASIYSDHFKLLGYKRISRYIRIKYDDVLGRTHEEFFSVDEFGGHKISNDLGESTLNKFHASITPSNKIIMDVRNFTDIKIPPTLIQKTNATFLPGIKNIQ